MTASSLAALGVVLLMAPVLPGLAARTVSALTGRRGAPILQPYADLAKLLGKGAVYSTTTSAVFRAGPLVLVGTVALAACLLPLDGRGAIAGFSGDVVAFAALLACGRFALTLAALDTGSSFEGMGASRELSFGALVEPALFLGFGALVLTTGSLSLTGMLGAPLARAWPEASASLVMIAVSLFVLLLAESGRVPVDDPATHLELTMIHEVAVLDHGGPDLAFVFYAGALRFALFGALIVGVMIPRGLLGGPSAIGLLVAGLAAVAVLVGVVESVRARLRLLLVPQLLLAAAALSALALLLRVVRP